MFSLFNQTYSAPIVMGILNVTPDSFSDGGQFNTVEKALKHAEKMLREGANIIDIGGESTRPGARPVTIQEELDRVIPLVEKIKANLATIISVDTSKPQVMTEAIQAGAEVINDVYALRQPGAIEAVAQTDAAVCLMHMQGEPRTMQNNPSYENVIKEIYDFLQQRIDACERAGINKKRIIIDPGFGFGKSLEHNLTLVHKLKKFKPLICPVLIGASRKASIGTILNKPVNERLYGSIAIHTIAAYNGANIIRTHDVAATLDAIKVAAACAASY